ncbi:hypothetical protein LAZ67_19002604 [Cordylochernes scorpioides]|uniref:Uncharacterized protein n=1 Tax=Cordylochernes scorpioides TaxID=51811 RepID=A0ABY6LIK6_9ARAC|nr:hypothetical protein LAZ67_19002604 [Cordylochernes scorpioides]
MSCDGRMKPDYKDRDCITYDDINEVMQEAKAKIGDLPAANFELSSVYPEPEHLAVAAEILLEATRCLAQRFSLGKGALLHALPAVDMTRVASDMCPSLLRPDVKCEMSRYRTLTGMCNNLEHPSWGSARSVFARYLPPDYSDGINEPRNARDGSDLPNPRVVSFMTHHDMSVRDQRHNILLVFWGQMIDHDMTLAAGTLDTERNDIECCKYAPADQHPNCMNIPVPSDDPFYKFYNRRCLDFARIWPGPKEGCPLGPRSQINTVSSFLDANFVYGSNQEVATRLREFRGGDERVNEQLMLTVMHTLWMRQHNNIAGELARINPAWSDETLYQETRHIVAALVQHLTYNEWLAPVIGWAAMRRYDLQPLTTVHSIGFFPRDLFCFSSKPCLGSSL